MRLQFQNKQFFFNFVFVSSWITIFSAFGWGILAT